jgi:hypothetical protein
MMGIIEHKPTIFYIKNLIFIFIKVLRSNIFKMTTIRKDVCMSDKRYDRIVEGIRKSYPNSCVLWIEEVINPTLEELYQNQKKEIETKRKKACNELELYHGSREEFINTICKKGFDPSVNSRSAYGKGTYFAKNASYSRDYAPPSSDQVSFMLISSVLIGEVSLYGSGRRIDTLKHDNSVDNITSPSIYVTPYIYGAIPRFIVAFHRYAT